VIRECVPAGHAHVVGLSLGGAAALALAKRFPALVDRLMVSGTSAGLGKTLGWVMRASAGMMGWFPQEMLINATFDQFAIPNQYRPALHDDLRIGVGAGFNRSVADALITVEIPSQTDALVVVGEKETLVAKRDARKLVSAISGARGMIVPQVGHVWNLQAPDLFTATVQAFVRGEALPTTLKAL
jgi:pimeloyl-ACP methyl ester carboxylesterase